MKKKRADDKKRMIIIMCMTAAALWFQGMLSKKTEITAAAQELGGFQVEMGTGEQTEVPPDWEEQWGQSDEQREETTGQTEFPEEVWQEKTGEDSYGAENRNTDSACNTQEVFWSGDSDESSGMEAPAHMEIQAPAEIQASVSEQPEVPTPTPEQIPVLTVTTAPTEIPAKRTAPTKIAKSVPGEIKNRDKGGGLGLFSVRESPRLFYWQGETDGEICLRFRADSTVQVLCFRINGKAARWNWKGNRIVAESKDKLPGASEKGWAELVVLAYGNCTDGIMIDEKNKS